MLLMIDNYDSFTYNLVHYLSELGAEVSVYRNDQITLSAIERLSPNHIVISPGPGYPDAAGISLAVMQQFAASIPILGVCLGHQCIGQMAGGAIIPARHIIHGKTSLIYHRGQGIFARLPSPFRATRYHSLVIDKTTLPANLDMTAWTQDEQGNYDEIMGVKHQHLRLEGVQFHPESILTQCGYPLLANFLRQ